MIPQKALLVGITALCASSLLALSGIFSPDFGEVTQDAATQIASPIADAPQQPNPVPLGARLAERGFALGQPVLLRVYKQENELELWLQRGDRFERALVIPICKWSGTLGPKLREGDGQSPEGFYLVSARQLNPASAYFRALNLGFPNAYDKAQGRTGSLLMIHGACGSHGCYAMTDAAMGDIYTAVEQALLQGQQAVPVHIFPFRMSDENLAAQANSPWSDFWKNLSEGDRLFSATGLPPRAFACGTRYGFAAANQDPPAGCTPIQSW